MPTTYTATATGPGGMASDMVRIEVSARPAAVPVDIPVARISLDEDFRRTIEDVYFDYDIATIRPDQVPKLKALATWLLNHPEARIIIEGHCDERGGQEYNVALGDSRAFSASEFLRDQGVGKERLQQISYGEEKPVCRDENETCWSRNRRAHFVLINQ